MTLAATTSTTFTDKALHSDKNGFIDKFPLNSKSSHPA